MISMIDEGRLYQMLGERLRKLREQQDGARGRMTQAELATKIGLERTSVTNIEKGGQKVPLHVLFRLCEVLKVSVAELLPAISEVQLDGGETSNTTSVAFGDRLMEAPPLAGEAIMSILNNIPSNAQSHSSVN